MKPLKSQEEIDEMRRRLYARGSDLTKVRHELTDTKIEVSRDWDMGDSNDVDKPDANTGAVVETEEKEGKKKRHYRGFILLGSLLIFMFVAIVSSLYLYFGGNQISSDNIQISVQGENYVGGGETLAMQIAVSNHNSIPIESATLILKYPSGTRSADDSLKSLYEDRIPIGVVDVGEVKNIPVSVIVFGEENDSKHIEATIEYRVIGSSGMFYKDAEPLLFKISSSPLVLRIENTEKVASGQLVDITMTAVSNASTPLTDILVSASYPNGFSFEESEPSPVFGDNVWKIDELLPEEEYVIKLKGFVSGLTEETFRINFSAGPTSLDNKYIVEASLAEGSADFLIERPFIDIDVSINGETKDEVIISEGEDSSVQIDITNTLDETVYDMVVEVVPGGNALDETSIRGNSGFYDSNKGVVRWEVANNSSFGRILPGDTRTLQFDVNPGSNRSTASYDLVVNVYARRVAETSAQEALIGTVKTKAKFSSTISLGGQAGRSMGGFSDTGPIPPKVGESSTYTISLAAEAGANDVTGAVVETSLPSHIEWLDSYEGEGEVEYNSISKKIVWAIGDIDTGARKTLTMQLKITPSVSQLNESPVLINTQKLRANDRFTGALLQDSSPAVTTELSTEMGFEEENGMVTQ